MLIPSIDLAGGKAVQLVQGRDKVLEHGDPLALAESFGRFGPIAIIDLDAAFGRGENEAIVQRLCGRAECIVGGGIRTVEQARKLFSFGASRLILGSRLFEGGEIDLQFLRSVTQAVGPQRVLAAIDAREGIVVTKGWRESTGIPVAEAVAALESRVGGFLYTAVEKEGLLQGSAIERIEALRSLTAKRIVAAGGITSVEEIVRLDRMGVDAQVGMALYTGRLTPEQSFLEVMDWEAHPLVPAITQDTAGQVLMLAYMNREALERTFTTNRVTYWSRSRGRLWTKGESSGHYQRFVAVRRDCDGDALLVTAAQQGPACHTNQYSCFGDRRFSLEELYAVLADRIASGSPGSYTAGLSPKRVRQKLLEEAAEVALADERDEKVREAADLIYFLSALLAKERIGFDEVMTELRRRRRSGSQTPRE
jgi:phosphoribosyl-ATP pyrophosphohydrolase/phosphoribosyl-AMP cyclohydrolase